MSWDRLSHVNPDVAGGVTLGLLKATGARHSPRSKKATVEELFHHLDLFGQNTSHKSEFLDFVSSLKDLCLRNH